MGIAADNQNSPILILALILFVLGWGEGAARVAIFMKHQSEAGFPILDFRTWQDAWSGYNPLETCSNPDVGPGKPPFLTYCTAGDMLHTNGLGLRGRDPDPEALAHGRVVVVLGASTVFGWGVASDDATHAGRIAQQLAAEKVAVLNAGVPSMELAGSMRLYETYLVRFSPRILVLYTGWDALGNALMKSDYYQTISRMVRVSYLFKILFIKLFFQPFVLSDRFHPPEDPRAVDRYETQLVDFFHRHPQTRILLLTLPTFFHAQTPFTPEAFVGMTEYSASVPTLFRYFERINAMLRGLARTPNVKVVDAAKDFQTVPRDQIQSLFLGDIGHLSDAGHERLARLLLPEVRAALGMTETSRANPL
ncbi:MAG: SGNH/GDSL hydrolase family protein [Magnetococcales bacterium]|nr:SGNH/GDSL hydrolase family protein [Magnetococcales bacterium]MBF0323156.1 SGNH/GDSL hydrolase family protein [Magnetococcales bacterium]